MLKVNMENVLKSSWDSNADAWTNAVRGGNIHSRKVATDAAIVQAVTRLKPKRVLDVGCGEGWLTRALTEKGIETTGIDGSAALIEAAHAARGGTFHTLSYEDLIADPEELDGPYNAIVCNFALLGEKLVPLLTALKTALAENGHLVVQTVHPWVAAGDAPYEDGWRQETFAAFGEQAWEPMPWYFRTVSSWIDEFGSAGLVLTQMIEPTDPETGKPLSIIFICANKSK